MYEFVDVIMRSRNDAGLIDASLESLFRQKHPFRLTVFDNDSHDGTLDIIKKYNCRIINVPAGTYVPGRVLNQGMRETDSEFVVFLNSDCQPLDASWLTNLVHGLAVLENVAAVFGRQEPRPDCHFLLAKDTWDTFSDGVRQKYWRHCFSMAASAIRRSVWQELPFSERLNYSEDIDWTWQARQKGYQINYVQTAAVYHSHNYTLDEVRKRAYGEGRAEAHIFDWSRWERSLWRYSLLPLCRQFWSDFIYASKKAYWRGIGQSFLLRTNMTIGRRQGFLAGLKEKTTA